MAGGARDKRKCPRIDRSPLASSWDATHRHPVLINVGGGGACLWFHDPPFALGQGSLYFHLRSKPRESLPLRARLVWMRTCKPTQGGANEGPAEGWLAGVAFTPGQLGNSPAEDLSDQVDVDLLPESGFPAAESQSRNPVTAAAPEGPLLNSLAASRFGAAAESLLPVLAKHFVDIKLVLRPDRLEISAPFKPLDESRSVEASRQNLRRPHGPPVAISHKSGWHVSVQPTNSSKQVRHEFAASEAPPLPMSQKPDPGAAPAKPASGWLQGRGLVFAALAILMAFVGLRSFGPLLDKGGGASTARNVPVQQERNIPAWGGDLDESSVDGWVEVKTRFGLSDAEASSAIRILKINDRYPPGHSLSDLTAYPPQMGRAFALLAGATAKAPSALGALREDLQARLASGARFPDESPGYRYFSNLDPRLFHNAVVLAAIELIHRRQQDPDVRALLVTLKGSGT